MGYAAGSSIRGLRDHRRLVATKMPCDKNAPKEPVDGPYFSYSWSELPYYLII